MSPDAPLIAVLTIGDELLSGEVQDSNLQSIATALRPLGLSVSRHVTVADSVDDIATEVDALARSCDVVIVTGGLGPTSDDLTTESVAKAAGRSLVFHPHLEKNLRAFFDAMGRPMRDENLKQACLPEGASEIPPAGGTAPGFILEHEGALVAVLPGVPREMESMLATAVIPALRQRFASAEVCATRRLMTFGMGESDIAGVVSSRIGAGPVKYGFLVMGGPIVVKLTATAGTMEEAAGLLDVEQAAAERLLGDLLYAVDDEPMEAVVGALLRERGLTIATAESVTAGMVSARLANVPGSSDYLKGGIVAYAVEEKERLLEVPAGMLAAGTVSREVAEAMARGAAKVMGADIGVATTGVAGPGAGGETKPVGTCAIAVAHDSDVFSLERRLPGPRQMVRNIATFAALNMVRLHLKGRIS